MVFGFNHILDDNEEMEFTFDIVFHEAGIAECEPILPMLMRTLTTVLMI